MNATTVRPLSGQGRQKSSEIACWKELQNKTQPLPKTLMEIAKREAENISTR